MESQSQGSLTVGDSAPVIDKESTGLTSWPPNSGVSISHRPKGQHCLEMILKYLPIILNDMSFLTLY